MIQILTLLGALGIFLYGMRVMSEGIQKVAGEKMQTILNFMTANRILAVFTGFFITSLIQSSSATTVMVVSFVNANLLNLVQAIGVVMGANIGTTVTTWIVSFVGFKFNITAFALPIIGIGLPLMFSKYRKRRDLAEIFIGFGLLFLGLMFMKNSVPDIRSNPEILEFLKHYTNLGLLSYFIFVLVGTTLTVIVQSSSAAMAITVTMAYIGWIDFYTAAAIILGENIGTTITAYLASIGTSVNARRTARAHFLFNVFGVFWMTLIFKHFATFILSIAPWNSALQENLPLNLALFHTFFNITNTLIFLPFIKPFSELVMKIVKPKPRDTLTSYKLQYISSAFQDTAQINILEAKSEISKMAEITFDMFQTFLNVFNNPDKKMGDKVEAVKKQEELTDHMQEEITRFLVECSKEELSERNVMNLNAMLRIVNELENIGDSCFKLMILTEKKYLKKIKLHEKAQKEFQDIAELLLEFMSLYKSKMNTKLESRVLDMAYKLEGKINLLRDSLKKGSQRRLQAGSNVKSELIYLDLLKHFEHIGDYSLNIAQALRQLY
jgi:phosphate:Na+ symporter